MFCSSAFTRTLPSVSVGRARRRKKDTDNGRGEAQRFPDAVIPETVHDRTTRREHELVTLAFGPDILGVGLLVLIGALPATRDEFLECSLPPVDVCVVGRRV